MAITALQNRYSRLASEYASLAAAVTAIGATPTTLVLDEGWTDTMAGNVTIPATLSIVNRGGLIDRGGFTLTINGNFDSPSRQVFAGAGTTVFGPTAIEKVKMYWFGISGLGLFDDSAAVQEAVTAAWPIGKLDPGGGSFLLDTLVHVDLPLLIEGNVGPLGARPYFTVQETAGTAFEINRLASGTVFRGFSVIGVGATSTAPGILVTNSNNNIFDQVEVRLFDEGVRLWKGIEAPFSSYSNVFKNCNIISNNSFNIRAMERTNLLTVDTCTLGGGAPIGLSFVDSVGLDLRAPNFEGCTEAPIDIDATVAGLTYGINIYSPYLEANTSTGGDIRLGATAVVRGVTILGGEFSPGAGNIAGINALNVDGLFFGGMTVQAPYTDVAFFKRGNVTRLQMGAVYPLAAIQSDPRYNYSASVKDSDYAAPTVYDANYGEPSNFNLLKLASGNLLAKSYFGELDVAHVVDVGGAATAGNGVYARAMRAVNSHGGLANVRALLSVGAFDQSLTALTYGVSVDVYAPSGNDFTLTITDGVAFTVNAPVHPPPTAIAGLTQKLTFTLRNTSGGAAGVATWNAVYKMAAWTQPATGFSRSITFGWNGTNWVEVGRTPADVPN